MADDIVVHPPCKTIDCIKKHLSAYLSGQCSRHYGPKVKPAPHDKFDKLDSNRIDPNLYDYSHDADSDSPKPEEVGYYIRAGNFLT